MQLKTNLRGETFMNTILLAATSAAAGDFFSTPTGGTITQVLMIGGLFAVFYFIALL